MNKPGKIIASIEARMTSSRLPGKVMLPADNKPLIKLLVERLKAVRSLDEIVLATTVNAADDPLVACAEQEGISVYRGSEENVMDRVIRTAGSVKAEIIVEITADCPVIDPLIVEQTLQMYLNNDCDYASNAHVRSYPDGMDVQVFSLSTLRKSYAMTNDPLEHEHVTLHMRRHSEIFRPVHLFAPPDLYWPELGLTLDQKEDYELLKKMIEHFSPHHLFSCRDMIELLHRRPEWLAINRWVKRKGDT